VLAAPAKVVDYSSSDGKGAQPVPGTDNPTPRIVAEWMLGEVERRRELYQEDAAFEITKNFGEQFTYENDNGNLAISRTILTAFRKISEGTVVWERGSRSWRLREPHDEPGRQQL
jgi:hypothetical protein